MPSRNPQVGRDAQRRWRERHPDKVREQKRLYYIRHRQRLRAIRNPGNLARAQRLRQHVLAAFGGCCQRCGFADPRALQVDHINGGGGKDRRRFRNTESYLRAILENRDAFQLLCANCNWIKKYERGEHGRALIPEAVETQIPLFAGGQG
jgi:hypothetical protein